MSLLRFQETCTLYINALIFKTPVSGTSVNLPFISAEIEKLTKLDISSCSPEGFEIRKQRWDSVMTILSCHGP